MKTQEKFALSLVGAIAALTLFGAPKIANAMPGDMLDQALHQSMREHSSAQNELSRSGTTRTEDKDAKPSVEANGIRIVVGQGEILADSNSSIGLSPDLRPDLRTDLRSAPLKATHASLGTAEPSRMDASAGIGEQESSENLTADQELLDPVP